MTRRILSMLMLVLFLISGCASPKEDSTAAETLPTESTGESSAETIAVPPPPPILKVHFLSTDQSDCIFVECDGQTLLIDSGTSGMASRIVNYLERQGVEDLDYVISTHEHYDHVGGFPAVFNRFPVGKLYGIKADSSVSVYKRFLNSVKKHKLTLTEPALGEQFYLGDAVVTFLGPVQTYEEINDNSIVVKIEYGQRSFLLTADMEAAAEADILEYWGSQVSWNADVLKVGHHGLATSTTGQFAQAVCPEHAVATSSHKTKNSAAKETLQAYGAAFYRTDLLVPVVSSTNGTRLNVTWSNQENFPEYPWPTATLHYYGSTQTSLFHMERCPNLVSTQGMQEFVSFDAALYYGMTPCGLCLGSAFG